MSAHAVELLGQYLDIIQRLDAEAAIALLDDNATVAAPLLPEEMKLRKGKAVLAPAYRTAFGIFKSLEWIETNLNATDDPDLAVARCKANVVLKDGRAFVGDFCIFVRGRNGKATEITEYFASPH